MSRQGGFLGFLGTIPGILTAVAGVITSLATPYGVLVEDCYYGDPYSCDVRYEISPVGSGYEAYGATCGGLVVWQYGRCSEP